jgi:5-methylcytosine-specific restriction endonuclease McrA
LPRVSQRRRRIERERRQLVAEVLAARPRCQAQLDGCTLRSVDVHEVKTRGRGGSILDPANVLALCRSCHDWVTEHPAEAVELGLMAHSWD